MKELKNSASEFIAQVENFGLKPRTLLYISCPRCVRSLKVLSGQYDRVTIGKYLNSHREHEGHLLAYCDGQKWRIEIKTSTEPMKPTQPILQPPTDPVPESSPPSTPIEAEPVTIPSPASVSASVPEPTPVPGTDSPEKSEVENSTEPEQKASPQAEEGQPQAQDQVESEEPELAASPQAEEGHIDFANELAEVLAKVNLSAYESRILWALWRKTYGWHKKTDQISVTKFQEATGIKRRHVHRTLNELTQRNIVTRIGNSRIITYGFQKDYTKWKDVTKRGNDAGISRVSGQVKKNIVTRIGNRSLPKGVPTKETNKRKIYVEGCIELRLASFLLSEIQKNKPDFKQPNLQTWAREFDLAMRVDKRSAEAIVQVILWAQSDHGDGGKWGGWAVNILSPGSLRKQFDRLELAMAVAKESKGQKQRDQIRDLTGTGQVEVGE